MIDIAGYARVTCGVCSGSDCEAVELNSWLPFLFQQAAEIANSDRLVGFRSGEIRRCLCDDAQPAELLTEPKATLGSGDPMGWWWDPTRDDLTNAAWGFLFHSFTLEDPKEFSASRTEKLRGRVRLIDGLILGEMTIEAVGLNRRSTRALFHQVKLQLEDFDPCCGRTIEVFEDCCSTTGPGTAARLLTDVSEFNVTISDQPALTSTGTVFSVVFAADSNLAFPDEAVTATTASLGSVSMPTCPATTEMIDETEFTPKDRCLTDIELQADGTLKVCPVDYDTFDPATCYMDVREVRASDAITDPCPVEVNLKLTGPVPVVTPLQKDLYQTEVLDKIGAGGIDCTNPPAIRSLTVRNPDYRPDCPECMEGLDARACAESAGLVVGDDGFIDLEATYTALDGGSWPGTLVTTWDYTGTAPTLPATVTAMIQYIECVSSNTIDLWKLQFCNPYADSGGWDEERVELEVDGSFIIRPRELPGGATHCNCVQEIRDVVGMSFSGTPFWANQCGSANPVTATPMAAIGCGPGQAPLLDTFTGGANIASNADLSRIAYTSDTPSTGLYEADVATLTQTLVTANHEGGWAINHTNDEVWNAHSSGTTIDLYEDGTIATTVNQVDWGKKGFPVWDIAGNRMLIFFSGLLDIPANPNVREDFVVATWTTGGVLTEIFSEPMNPHPSSGLNDPAVSGFPYVTPQGGFFFACENDQESNPIGNLGQTSLNYWHPIDGFTFALEFNVFFGDALGMTPAGDFVYWNSNTPPLQALSINENDLLPSQSYNACSPDNDTAYAGSYAPGPNFETGLAATEGPASQEGNLYAISHENPENNDCGTLPDYCFETITIDNPSQSGPCVQITLNASGAAASDVNPSDNDLSRSKFEFGPCSAISTPDCVGVIPASPELTVDTTTDTAAASGWTLGFGWPAETTGDQYEVITVDAVANNNDPATATVQREVLLLKTASCPSPFDIPPVGRISPPTPLIALPGSATVTVATASGLSPDMMYRPEWTLTAGANLTDVHVYLWSGPASQAAPSGGNLDTFMCDPAYSPTPIKEILSGRKILNGPCGLLAECSDGSYRDALAGWVDATVAWDAPSVSGAEKIHLLVIHSGAVTVELEAVPIGAP